MREEGGGRLAQAQISELTSAILSALLRQSAPNARATSQGEAASGGGQGALGTKAQRSAMAPFLCKRPAGAVLGFEGEAPTSIFCILSGWLSVSKSLENGHRQILDVLLPGDTLSTRASGLSGAAVQIEALSPVIALILPQRTFALVALTDQTLQDRLERGTAAVLARMAERMLRLGRGNAEARIAYAICELCLRVNREGLHDGARLWVPMNQSQFGDFTGLSSVHVCRVLRRLRKLGIVEMTDRLDLTILDATRLAALAETDPEQLRTRLGVAPLAPASGEKTADVT